MFYVYASSVLVPNTFFGVQANTMFSAPAHHFALCNLLQSHYRYNIDNNKGQTDRYIRKSIIRLLSDKNFKDEIKEVWLYEKRRSGFCIKNSRESQRLPLQAPIRRMAKYFYLPQIYKTLLLKKITHNPAPSPLARRRSSKLQSYNPKPPHITTTLSPTRT